MAGPEHVGGRTGPLARLLEAEARLEERIAEAHRRADETRASAREQGRVALARGAEEVEALEGEYRRRAAREIERRRQTIATAAAEEAGRLEGTSDARVGELAGWVVQQIVTPAAGDP